MTTVIPASAKPCTTCFQRSNRQYYYSHHEQILQNQKTYYHENREGITSARRARYKAKKLEKMKAIEAEKEAQKKIVEKIFYENLF